MTITQLSYVVAVDKYKNFGVAAQHCHVTQPTLSMQIQKFEEEIGIILFDRSEQPIKTTKVGQLIVKQAQVVLKEAHKLSEIVAEEKDETKGEIRIAVIPTLAPYLMPLFLKNFMKANPTLKVVVEELQTSEIIKRIDDSEVDIGILVTPIDSDSLKFDPLFYEPFLVYASDRSPLIKNKKVEQKDLNSNDLWLLTEGHCFREQSLLVCRHRKKATDQNKNLLFESGSLETLKRMVDQENGFTLLPWLAAQDVKHENRVKEFVSPVPTREVSLVYSSYFRKDKIKQSLIDSIRKNLPKEIPQTATKAVDVVDLPIGKN